MPVGMAAITSLLLGAQRLSRQGVCRTRCRPAQGVSAGPQPESGGTDVGPALHEDTFRPPGLCFVRPSRNGRSCCAHPGPPAPELPSQTSPALGSDQYIPGPSTKPGRPRAPQLRGQGKQNRFVLSWKGSRVGRVLISSSDTCGLRHPGLPSSLWATVGPRLLSAPLLTGWSMF